ncbi:MAG: hypothetical protein AAGG01_06590 [Planctomycetota bacterium]
MKTTHSPSSPPLPSKLAQRVAVPAASTILMALAMALVPSAAAAPAQGAKDVEVVRKTFQRLDANGDGKVTSKEAARGKISSKVFAAHDDDGSAALSTDEFLVLYNDLLVQAKRPVPKDLSDEVIRIQARRRAIAESKSAKSKGAAKPGATATAASDKPAGKGAGTPAGRPSLVPTSLAPVQSQPVKPQPVTAKPVTAQPVKTQQAAPKSVVPVKAPSADATGSAQPAKSAAGSTATPEETAKRIEEARRKQADLDEIRIREARIKAADSAEARTRAAREKEAQAQAEARIRAAREQQARDSAKARTIAARKKAALEAEASGKDGSPEQAKAERVPGGKVRSTTRKAKGVMTAGKKPAPNSSADADPPQKGNQKGSQKVPQKADQKAPQKSGQKGAKKGADGR